jgi:hypothetical protein
MSKRYVFSLSGKQRKERDGKKRLGGEGGGATIYPEKELARIKRQ